MQVQIKYFASLREALGPGERRDTPAATVAQLRDELIAQGGAHAQALDRQRPVRAALDQAEPPSRRLLGKAEPAALP